MKMSDNTIPNLAAAAALAAVFVFWFVFHPEYLNYHEQNQLFLLTADYLAARLAVPGGLADWLSEGVVQFFCVPWIGALLLSAVLVGTGLMCGVRRRVAALVVPALLMVHMGDPNALVSFPVALLMVLAAARALSHASVLADALALLVLYWLAGPVAVAYWLIRCLQRCHSVVWSVGLLAVPMVAALVAHATVLGQYPLRSIVLGINYYRVPMQTPALQVAIPVTAVLVYVCPCPAAGLAAWLRTVPGRLTQAGAVLAVACVGVAACFPRELTELLRADMLVRLGRWDAIISRAESYMPHSAFASQCVNLALAQRRQLAERQFEFYQSGSDALIQRCVRDNTTDLPSAEAFYHLGMVNSCLRYYSDIQESILNARKSGRCEKRIAECLIVNGDYRVAQKHLDLLKKSLFYAAWARDAERCIAAGRVDEHPRWGWMRRQRFKENFLYDYVEIDKVLGRLFLNNRQNTMSLDYFLAQMLLDGNVQGFAQYLPLAQTYGGHPDMPAGYADAIRCIRAQGRVDGSSYADYARRQMSRSQTERSEK